MSTHKIQFHDKISLNTCFSCASEEFRRDSKLISHGKRVIDVRAIEIRLYAVTSSDCLFFVSSSFGAPRRLCHVTVAFSWI